MISITKKQFLIFTWKHKLYEERTFLIRVSNILFKKEAPDKFPTNVNDKSIQFIHDGATYEISDHKPDMPVFAAHEEVTLDPGDLPNVFEKVKTTYRKAFINIMVLIDIFEDKVPYIKGPINNRSLSAIVETRLRSKELSMPKYFEMTKMMSFIEVMVDSCVISSSDEVLGTLPTVTALKNKLVAEHKDHLDDPVVVAKINKLLVEEIRVALKDSPAFKYMDTPKIIGKSILMTHGMMGGVQRLDDPTKVDTVTNSLIEGLQPENLPSVVNNLRAGSIDRGELTALGGAAAKGSGRVYQNTKIAEVNCGTKVGEPFYIDGVINKELVGYYEPGKEKPLTLEHINKNSGKIIYVRMPIGCNTINGNYCEKCMGDSVVDATTALGPYMSEYSNVYMQISLAQFHGKNLETRKYNFGEFCS